MARDNAIPFHFTEAELEQLRSYIAHRDTGHDGGWYYGSKKDFELRHTRLRAMFGLPPSGDGK